MFCPQCGQQQPSDEVRFCPRCGLPLAAHAALLSTYDPAAEGPVETRPLAPTRKRKGMRRGAKLMFFGAALFPIFLVFSLAIDTGEPMMVPFVLLFLGLAWWAYARLFGDDLPHVPHVTQDRSRGESKAGANRPALGAQQFVPASSFDWQRANTAEIARPPSVTENTTTLLDKDV